MITIAVTGEPPSETRVALNPEMVKKLVGIGATVKVVSGAGQRSRFLARLLLRRDFHRES